MTQDKEESEPASPENISSHLLLSGIKPPSEATSPKTNTPITNSPLQQSLMVADNQRSPKEKALAQSRTPLKDIESLQFLSNENLTISSSGFPAPSKISNSRSALVSSSSNPLLFAPSQEEQPKSSILLQNETSLDFLQVSAPDLDIETIPETSNPIAAEDEPPSLVKESPFSVRKLANTTSNNADVASKHEAALVAFDKERHALLASQKQLESQLNAALDKIKLQDQEVEDLKIALADRSRNDALKDALNNLQTRFEAVKLDADNARLHSQKLQSEIAPLKKRIHSLEEALDNRNDAFEMAIVDKCVAEENLEIFKNEIKILKSHVEELSLELELGSAKEPIAVQTITNSHELAIMNEKLTTALFK